MSHPLFQHREHELSLDDLVQAASALLQTAPEPTDGRVQPLPDRRTIRYYQSSGLVDRPLRYQGRQARYGYRHLLQVLTVKLLQRQGSRLARIQSALAGLSSARLESAVLDGLQLPGSASSAPAAPPAADSPRALVSVALAPGVVVTVDPALVADPQGLVARLHHALSGGSE